MMKTLQKTLAICSLCILGFNSSYAQQWDCALSFGGDHETYGKDVAADIWGNALVVGSSDREHLYIGDSIYLCRGGFFVKVNPNWQTEWIRTTVEFVQFESVATDVQGNAYVTGSFYDTAVTLGSIVLRNKNYGGPDTQDAFVAKYDSGGQVIWAVSFDADSADRGVAITSKENGDIYVAGEFNSSKLIIGTDTLINTLAGTKDIFVCKLDSSGTIKWAKSFGGIKDETVTKVSCNKSGSLYLTGSFESASFSVGGNVLNLAPSTTSNELVVKFNDLGIALWTKSFSKGTVRGISTNTNDNFCIVGNAEDTIVQLDAITLTNPYPYIPFIAGFDFNGSIQWAKKDTADLPFGSGTLWDVEADNNLWIVHGAGQLVFVKAYDGAGSIKWSEKSGGYLYDYNSRYNGKICRSPSSIYILGTIKWNDEPSFGNCNALGADWLYPYVAGLFNTYTSINESKGEATHFVSLFPNPTNRIFTISAAAIIESICVANFLGQIIYQSSPNSSNFSFEMDQPGMYFVTTTSENKSVTQKLMVQR